MTRFIYLIISSKDKVGCWNPTDSRDERPSKGASKIVAINPICKAKTTKTA